MLSRHPYVHAEFGFLCPTPRLRRLVRLALISILLGASVFALGRWVYREDGASVVAQTIQTVTAQADDKSTLASQMVTSRVDDKSTAPSQGAGKNLAVIRKEGPDIGAKCADSIDHACKCFQEAAGAKSPSSPRLKYRGEGARTDPEVNAPARACLPGGD